MAFAGAAFIAVIFATENISLRVLSGGFWWPCAFITMGGFVGSLVDSLLGATLQAQYASEGIATERRSAPDGTPNRLVRGLPVITNDVVNLASCALVTMSAVLLAPVLPSV
jgi:uncharacterized membrane protein